jgi:hypothetical protein
MRVCTVVPLVYVKIYKRGSSCNTYVGPSDDDENARHRISLYNSDTRRTDGDGCITIISYTC